ncbi:MAG TPA: DNA polymerase III subunit gamma/tau, partial [Verrucomicrobiae bacterium]|nr:DNA polymerase III subunit gamma/tau [Verrucomicrobiae bacterium]
EGRSVSAKGTSSPPAPPAVAPTLPPVSATAPAETSAVAPGPALAGGAVASPAEAGAVDLVALWGAFLEAVGRASGFTRTYLLEAHPVSFVRNILTIGFPPGAEHASLVDNAKTKTLLQTKLQELGHANAQVRIVQAARPADWAPPETASNAEPIPAAPVDVPPPFAVNTKAKKPEAPAAAPLKAAPVMLNKDDFKNDPLIKQALEIFKGQIIEVRG